MFLMYNKKWGCQQVRWSKLSPAPNPESYIGSLPIDKQGNFTDLSGCAGKIGSLCIHIEEITHWMPRPDPPKEK